jgi:hypothetical protein
MSASNKIFARLVSHECVAATSRNHVWRDTSVAITPKITSRPFRWQPKHQDRPRAAFQDSVNRRPKPTLQPVHDAGDPENLVAGKDETTY